MGRVIGIALLALVVAYGVWTVLQTRQQAQITDVLETRFRTPVAPPVTPQQVYHLGHSLVGRDMPAMLAQLAGAGHDYHSQLGWGSSLKSHWEPDVAINGFEAENAHPKYRDAAKALDSGAYDAFVATEMVEIRDAIKYHDSAIYLARWAERAKMANPDARVYLYQTWHPLDDPEGWLDRLDKDKSRYWEAQILGPALNRLGDGHMIHVIPADQVMATFARAVEERGGVANVSGREALFAMDANGEQDPIHLSDLGTYLVALTHYAVLYHQSPVGLPHVLTRADGTAAVAPGPAAARLMQDVVWQVVTTSPKTGVSQRED